MRLSARRLSPYPHGLRVLHQVLRVLIVPALRLVPHSAADLIGDPVQPVADAVEQATVLICEIVHEALIREGCRDRVRDDLLDRVLTGERMPRSFVLVLQRGDVAVERVARKVQVPHDRAGKRLVVVRVPVAEPVCDLMPRVEQHPVADGVRVQMDRVGLRIVVSVDGRAVLRRDRVVQYELRPAPLSEVLKDSDVTPLILREGFGFQSLDVDTRIRVREARFLRLLDLRLFTDLRPLPFRSPSRFPLQPPPWSSLPARLPHRHARTR